MKQKIRILIVDDHFLLRMGLAEALNMEPDLATVGEAASGEEALEKYRRLKPDVVLMDIKLPGINGVQATARLCEEFPGARVIMLSTYAGSEDIHRSLEAGAKAYLIKDVVRSEILKTIRAVAAGRNYILPYVASRLQERNEMPPLSARELDVLAGIAEGCSNKEISSRLGIAEATVKLHVGNLLEKLQAHDRTEALAKALRRGIVHLE